MERVFGIHAVHALLRDEPRRVKVLFVQNGRGDQRLAEIRELAIRHGTALRELPRRELDGLVKGVHQGVVAEIEAAPVRTEAWLLEKLDSVDGPVLLLVLDGITDPHNLGACLRSADAAGAHAVIVPKDNPAPLSPVVRKVACGAAERVPVIQVTNLARSLRELQQRGIWLAGAAGEAEQVIYDIDLTGPVALLMGAEGSGLRRLTRECCDYLVQIPMQGSVSSLNVSVAAGICLFEALRQRRAGRSE